LISIADALAKVGKEVISLEGKGIITELEITEGMKLEKVLFLRILLLILIKWKFHMIILIFF
jgi:hypothetical protein